MSTRLVPAIVLAAGLLALAGCGGSDGAQSEPPTEATPTAPPPSTTASPTTETAEDAPTRKPKPKPKPTRIMIRVVEGRPQGGIARPTVKKNSRVVFVVRSDLADEVHLHGYDISRPVAAGGTARIAFVAKVPGRFEVELENIGSQIAELTVR